MRTLMVALLVALVACALTAQTMVESAVLTGATSTAAGAKGKSIGGSISNVFGKVNGTLAGAADSAPASRTAQPRAAGASQTARPITSEPPPPKPSESVFEGVGKGMPREELLAKAGKPSFSFSMTEEGRLEETLRYNTKEGSSAKIRVTDGKVSSIEWLQPN